MSIILPLCAVEQGVGHHLWVSRMACSMRASSRGSALSLALIGYLYDFTGSYLPMFWIALGFHAVNLVLLGIIAKSAQKKYN